MNWGEEILTKVEFNNINQREEKEKIAKQITEKVKDGQVIGFGSGSTSYLTVIEIAKKNKRRKHKYNCNSYFIRNKNALC